MQQSNIYGILHVTTSPDQFLDVYVYSISNQPYYSLHYALTVNTQNATIDVHSHKGQLDVPRFFIESPNRIVNTVDAHDLRSAKQAAVDLVLKALGSHMV